MTRARGGRGARRVGLAVVALSVWVAGAALGNGPAPRALALPRFAIGRAHPAEAFPVLTQKRPIFILALGSDARPGQRIDRERSDSIHIIGLNPGKRRASILGFPRDSFVDIPGHGTNKINAAMSAGGPRLTIQTIEHLTGIHINFYVLTSFDGLKSIIDAIGGVTVNVPIQMHDRFSGANFSPGPQHMNGHQALAFARDRHDFPRGDIDRSGNQGRLMLSTLAEFHQDFTKDPGVMLTWIGAGMRSVQTDLGLDEVLKLGFTASKVATSHVLNCVVPATGGTVGGASIVNIGAGARSMYADMKKDGVLSHC